MARCHAETMARCHAETVERCHAETVARCRGETVGRCNATVRRWDGVTLRRWYGVTLKRVARCHPGMFSDCLRGGLWIHIFAGQRFHRGGVKHCCLQRTYGSRSRRLKSAASWRRKCKARGHQCPSSPVQMQLNTAVQTPRHNLLSLLQAAAAG